MKYFYEVKMSKTGTYIISLKLLFSSTFTSRKGRKEGNTSKYNLQIIHKTHPNFRNIKLSKLYSVDKRCIGILTVIRGPSDTIQIFPCICIISV